MHLINIKSCNYLPLLERTRGVNSELTCKAGFAGALDVGPADLLGVEIADVADAGTSNELEDGSKDVAVSGAADVLAIGGAVVAEAEAAYELEAGSANVSQAGGKSCRNCDMSVVIPSSSASNCCDSTFSTTALSKPRDCDLVSPSITTKPQASRARSSMSFKI